MIRSALASLALACALLAPAAHALAAPINAPSAQVLSGACSDGNTYTVVANSGRSGQNGQMNVQTWDPGFVIAGGSGHLVPTQFTFAAVDTSTGQALFSQTIAKGNGQAAGGNGTPLTCTIDFGPDAETPNAEDILTVVGTLVGR